MASYTRIKATMDKTKTTCNSENGSRSELWDRNCWIADSFASLISSRIEYLGEKYGDILKAGPDSPFWDLIRDLEYFCEELRVKNGLRHPGVLNRDEKFPSELEERL